MKQKLIELQGKMDEITTTIVDFNTSILEMDRSNRQKIQ